MGLCPRGHAHPHIAEADASDYAALSTPLVELAERVVEFNPWVERLRFVTSGSEATLACVRIARGATQRPKLLKFDGAFHGSHVEGVANFGWSNASNLPSAERTGTGGASAVDLARAEQLIAERAQELAAVIIDPVQRALVADADFVRGLRAAKQRHGVLLIFDEVVSGFRLARGGAQDYEACERVGALPIIPLRKTPAVKRGEHRPPECEHGTWAFAGADFKRKLTKWRCPTGECQPASVWRKASRLHPLIPRESKRFGDLYRGRGAVEREFGRLKNERGLKPLRMRGIERVALHADLCILATLASALARARVVPLAA